MMATIDRALNDTWWTLMLRGVIAVVFGVLAFAWPGLSVAALVILFGAFAFVDGIFNIIDAFVRHDAAGGRWVSIIQGLIGIGAGVVTFFWPHLTLIALISLMAAWAIMMGVFEIVAAIRLRHQINNEWLLVLTGILSIVLGIAFIMYPVAGLIALIWWIGAYAIVTGIMLLALGFRLRWWYHHPEAMPRMA
jgi:uncharacterized membrane protein HdeD (DUF308 family)